MLLSHNSVNATLHDNSGRANGSVSQLVGLLWVKASGSFFKDLFKLIPGFAVVFD